MSSTTKPADRPATRPTGTSRSRLVALVVLNVALAVTGVWFVVGGGRSAPPTDPPPAPVHAFTSAPPGTVAGPLPAIGDAVHATSPSGGASVAARGCTLPIKPGRVVIPALCVDAPVVPTPRTSEGDLTIPHDVHIVGRWDASAGLADPPQTTIVGTTLLAGHVNMPGQGSGALYQLGSVRPDDLVYTADPAGPVSRWRVVSLIEVHKDRLPPEVFAGRSGPRRLVIVTCGGPIIHLPGHGASYRDNIIVTAVPA